MLKLNKKLTALALLTVTSVAGAMLTISNASAQNAGAVKDVVLKDRAGRVFSSNDGVADLGKVGFDNRAVAASVNNNVAWRFYEDKNFKGEFVQIQPKQARNLGKLANKVSSFCALANCPK
jgi:hypothetical protein